MYYTYSGLLIKYKSNYQIKKALVQQKIMKIKPGLYSDDLSDHTLAEVFIKRNDTILTLQSAFQYHGVSDYVPESIFVATPRNAHPMKIKGVTQVFMANHYHPLGTIEVQQDGYMLRVYDLERTLIELIRFEKKIPFEEYHHVIKKFREKVAQLDYHKVTTYAKEFTSFKKIINTIQTSIL